MTRDETQKASEVSAMKVVRTTSARVFVPTRTPKFPMDNRDYGLRGEQFKSLRQENLRRFKHDGPDLRDNPCGDLVVYSR